MASRHHGDPFDRLIVCQARALGLTIITRDRAFADYEVESCGEPRPTLGVEFDLSWRPTGHDPYSWDDRTGSAVRVLVYGAGVIGQIYAGRLAEAGPDVTVLGRGVRAGALAQRGISLQSPQGLLNVRVAVVEQVDPTITWDLVLITVRRDQLDPVLPVLASLTSTHIVFMLNQPLDGEQRRARVGADRTLFAFPGVGGARSDDGTIVYIEIPRQRTTVGIQQGRERPLVDLLRSARFPVATTENMPAWLATHAVFVAAVGAAIAAAGDASSLASNRASVRTMVKAIREGFRALAKTGTQVTPSALRTIFTLVPVPFAVSCWQRAPPGADLRSFGDLELGSRSRCNPRSIGRGRTPVWRGRP